MKKRKIVRPDWVDAKVFAEITGCSVFITALCRWVEPTSILGTGLSFILWTLLFSFLFYGVHYEEKRFWGSLMWVVLDVITVLLTGIMYAGSQIDWPALM